MGTFRVEIEIGDAAGERWERVEALVDTGATYTTVPAELLRRLGVTPHARDTFVLASTALARSPRHRLRLSLGRDDLRLELRGAGFLRRCQGRRG